MDPGYRYGGEALFFVTAAARLIWWLIKTTIEVRDDTGSSSLIPAASMSVEQRSRVMSMIADPPKIVEHRCPTCGTLIHADIVHGGFGACRTCGWTGEPQH